MCNNDDEISPLKQNLVTAYLYVYLSNDTLDIHTIRCNMGTIIWFTNYNSNLGTWDFKRDFKKYSNQIIASPIYSTFDGAS